MSFTAALGARTTGAVSLEYLPSYEDDSSLALINPAYNAYDVEYSFSNCPSLPVFEGVTFRGLAAYDADFGEVILIANGLWAGDPSGQVFVLER